MTNTRWTAMMLACAFATACGHSPGEHAHEPGARVRMQGDASAPSSAFRVGPYSQIYDPSDPERLDWWYINDHTFVLGPDDRWHMFGITHAEPNDPLKERSLAHAASPELTAYPWTKLPPALTADPAAGETHLWAPHVINVDGVYLMYYCAGGADHAKYRIHLARSTDLMTWKRDPHNPMFEDGYDARDPFVLRIGNEWIMYYTATSAPEGGDHLVAFRRSADLVTWSPREVAFIDGGERGTYGGGTESPTVVQRGDFYYLFVGPRPWPTDYLGTEVFRSRTPFHWELADKVGRYHAHASELVRDRDGRTYVSHAGWGQRGLFLAPFVWTP